MIVDASALLAIVFDEPEGEPFNRLLADTTDDLTMSPVNFVEAAIRADRHSPQAGAILDELMRISRIGLADVTRDQTELAREAYRRYGKGRHPAELNLGDCFAYALAKARSEPLLFKGDDFRRTDVEPAF